jgi:hypothetical protein
VQERLWFEFFRMTGMREQEVMHCSWDITLPRGTVTVRYKPEYGFSAKNYEEREIPIPAKRQGIEGSEGNIRQNLRPLVSNCRMNFLECLNAVAERAEHNKEDFWLHKFAPRSQCGACGPEWICGLSSSG